MSNATLTVHLTPELKDFVEAKVRSGRYQDSSEVIRDALRTLEEGQGQTEDPALERLIDEGLASGPGRRLTPAVWKEIWARGDQLARQPKRRVRKIQVSLPVFILPKAEADLAAIRAYLLRVHAEQAAERFKPAVEEAAEFLGQCPFAGRRRHFRTPGLRSWQVPGFERYLIFYRVTDERIEIAPCFTAYKTCRASSNRRVRNRTRKAPERGRPRFGCFLRRRYRHPRFNAWTIQRFKRLFRSS